MRTIKDGSILQCCSCNPTGLGCAGFTLFEQLAVATIAAIALSLTVPSVGRFVASQQLHGAVSILSVFVQEAREAALTTGCDVELLASPSRAQVQVDVRVRRNTDVLACSRWFEFNNAQSSSGTTIQSGFIDKVTLSSSSQLLFEGSSGQLRSTSPRTLSMIKHDVSALVTVPTLGSPTVIHVR